MSPVTLIVLEILPDLVIVRLYYDLGHVLRYLSGDLQWSYSTIILELDGKCFTPMVSNGQRVKTGKTLAIARIDVIEDLGYKTDIAVLITNSDEYKIENMYFGFAKGGEAIALSYRKI